MASGLLLLCAASGLLAGAVGLVFARCERQRGRRLQADHVARLEALERQLQERQAWRDRQAREADALRETEDLFRRLTEASPIGVYLIQDGAFRYVNPAMATIFGWPQDELVASAGPRDLVHPDDWPTVAENIRRRLDGEIAFIHYEFRGVRRDGTLRDVEVFGSLAAFRGRPAVVGSLLDVTDRKQREREALKIEKLESLGVLAGGIAHDFNNLLTTVLGNVGLAQDAVGGGAPTEAPAYLAEAEQAVLRARDLTRQLMTFSRGGGADKRRITLGELITSSATFALCGSPVACRIELAPDLHPAAVDAGQLGQVIHNLVLNAAQAMPEGGTIVLRGENLPAGDPAASGLGTDQAVRISVIDQGPGIPAAIRGRIFDPYFTTKAEGTGLGLASCYAIVRRHGGRIDVTSEEGRGTCFAVLLPASPGPVEPQRTVPTAPRGAGGHVLVMDDDAAVRAVAARQLKQLGYQVTLARDGAEALALRAEAAQRGVRFEAALVDLTVPGGMGGRELAVRLGKIDPAIKVIATSGYAADRPRPGARPADFAATVAKPYRKAELAEALHLALGRAAP